MVVDMVVKVGGGGEMEDGSLGRLGVRCRDPQQWMSIQYREGPPMLEMTRKNSYHTIILSH